MLYRFWGRMPSAVVIIVLSSVVLFSCAGETSRVAKPLPLLEEDQQARALTPRPGKSLIYLCSELPQAPGGTYVSLDGAEAKMLKETYIVWETEPGAHKIEAAFHTLEHRNRSKGDIKTEADRVYYYYLDVEEDTRSQTGKIIHKALFFRDTDKNGRRKVAHYSLMGWFRDGEEVFLRETGAFEGNKQ